jgi:hypothetical protein
MTIDKELDKRRNDVTNYPGFKELEPVMQQIADDNPAIDLSKDLNRVLDALYKLARASHSDTAIQEAEKFGRQQAEVGLAKEAKTSVAGGGKGAQVGIDPKKMTGAQLRQHFVNLGMAE